MSILLLIVSSHQAYGDSVVTTVATQINYFADGKITTFVTRENTLANALSGQGIKLGKNDLTDPSLSTALVGQKIEANLIPAIPVLINDNGQSWVGKSAYTDTKDILAQLSVKVDAADLVTKDIILDPVTENAVGQEITIKRAPVYTLSVDDHDLVVHSWKTSVGDILVDGKVSLNQNDTADPAVASLAPTSGQIIVTRVNYADVEQTVAIPYSTSSQSSYDLYRGQSKVLQDGINGSKKQIIHIVYHNGVEVSRDVTNETVLSASQTRITSIGVKPYGHDYLWNIMVQAHGIYGIEPSEMMTVALCESGADPSRNTGNGYYGMYQWDGSFSSWAAKAGYPGASIFDPTAQIMATALRVSQNGWSAWGCKP